MHPSQLNNDRLIQLYKAIQEGHSTLDPQAQQRVLEEYRRRFPAGPDKTVLKET